MQATRLIQDYVAAHNAGTESGSFDEVRNLFGRDATINLVGASDGAHVLARFRRLRIELVSLQPMDERSVVGRYVHPETGGSGALTLTCFDEAISTLAIVPCDTMITPSALYPQDDDAVPSARYGAYAGAVLGNLDRRKLLWPADVNGRAVAARRARV